MCCELISTHLILTCSFFNFPFVRSFLCIHHPQANHAISAALFDEHDRNRRDSHAVAMATHSNHSNHTHTHTHTASSSSSTSHTGLPQLFPAVSGKEETGREEHGAGRKYTITIHPLTYHHLTHPLKFFFLNTPITHPLKPLPSHS